MVIFHLVESEARWFSCFYIFPMITLKGNILLEAEAQRIKIILLSCCEGDIPTVAEVNIAAASELWPVLEEVQTGGSNLADPGHFGF